MNIEVDGGYENPPRLTIGVSNGAERVGLGISDQMWAISHGKRQKVRAHASLTPDEAEKIGRELIEAAARVRVIAEGSVRLMFASTAPRTFQCGAEDCTPATASALHRGPGNEPNPILVDLRYQRRHSRLTASDLHDSFLDWLDHATPDNLYCREYGITADHIDHARRVIIRLDRLTEGESA